MNYKTRYSLFGLPLIHVAVGGQENGRYVRGVAKGWIAIGDISFGVILSVGGLAVGGIAFGGLGIGVLCLAGLAIGGYGAFGGLAISGYAALGGGAIAGQFAEGGSAIANHANDAVARHVFDTNWLGRAARFFANHVLWFVCPILVLWSILLVLLNARRLAAPRAFSRMRLFVPRFAGELPLPLVPDDFVAKIQQRLRDGFFIKGNRRRSNYVIRESSSDSLTFAAGDLWTAIAIGLNEVTIRPTDTQHLSYHVSFWKWTSYGVVLCGFGLLVLVGIHCFTDEMTRWMPSDPLQRFGSWSFSSPWWKPFQRGRQHDHTAVGI